MPSPVGHALGGLAVGLLASSRPEWRWLALCAFAAVLPDADFLLPIRHRGPSHSVGAALAVAVAFALAGSRFQVPGSRFGVLGSAAAVGVAYATHVLFDWLGADSSAPRGVMALWPVSTDFFVSDLDVFDSVDRRYWLSGFWRRSALSLARELAILVPITLLAWWWQRRPSSGLPGRSP